MRCWNKCQGIFHTIVLAGHIHPLTIMHVDTLGSRIRAVLSTYDATGNDLPHAGRYGAMYVQFYPGDEGATVMQVFGTIAEGPLSFTSYTYTDE